VAFDDGDLRVIPYERFQYDVRDGTIALMDIAEGGLVANVGGGVRAEDVTWYKGRPAGVLLGNTGLKMGGMLLYQSHVVQPASFQVAGRNRGSRSGAESPQNIRDYGGWHTFFKGDRVDYDAKNVSPGTKGAQGEFQCASAVVFGFAWHKGVKADQGRKFLILYEEASRVFFVGMCTRWRRKRGDGYDATKFDEDKHDQAATISVEICETMNADFEVSGPLAILALDSFTKVENQAKHLPPSLRGRNKEEAAAEKAAQKLQAREEAKTRAAAEKAQRNEEDRRREEDAQKRKRKAPAEGEGEEDEDNPITKKKKTPPPPLPKPPPKPLPKPPPKKPPKPPPPPHRLSPPRKPAPPKKQSPPVGSPSPPPPAPRPLQPLPRPLPHGWRSSLDKDGVIFYFNKDRTKVQYEEPSPASPRKHESPPPLPPPVKPPVARVPQLPQSSAMSMQLPTPTRLTQQQGSSSSSMSGIANIVVPQPFPKPLEQQRLKQMAALRSQLLYATSEENKMRIAGLLAELELAHDQGWT
jgi:hypothetical protein